MRAPFASALLTSVSRSQSVAVPFVCTRTATTTTFTRSPRRRKVAILFCGTLRLLSVLPASSPCGSLHPSFETGSGSATASHQRCARAKTRSSRSAACAASSRSSCATRASSTAATTSIRPMASPPARRWCSRRARQLRPVPGVSCTRPPSRDPTPVPDPRPSSSRGTERARSELRTVKPHSIHYTNVASAVLARRVRDIQTTTAHSRLTETL